MPAQKIKDFLTQHKIHYLSVSHPQAYATREISHLSNISERAFAKSVLIHAGNKTLMIVLPANERIEFDALKKILRENSVTLVPEEAFLTLFPDCEIGAMPPFGNLYNIQVYVDKTLSKNKEIAFNAGNHSELIKMNYQDFEKLVKPILITMH
jgi:Ala-tRNA(Pro) deacylase